MTSKLPQTKFDNGKQPYQTPTLVCYGALRDLTQSGTGTLAESIASGTCSANLSRKPCTPSDRCAKENIVRIGAHPLGISLYLFDYTPEFRDEWGHGRQFGVMADEVETVMPKAVCMHPDGYKMVNYAMLGITRFVH